MPTPGITHTIADYRIARKAGDENRRKKLAGELNTRNKRHGIAESSIQAFTTANKNSGCFKDHLDAHTTQTIASRAFNAVSKWRFNGYGKPRFKSWQRGISSCEGKNKSCIRIIPGDETNPTSLVWKNLVIPLKLDKKDKQGYQSAALDLIEKEEWKYCRILSRKVRGRSRLYVQVVLPGRSFIKARHRAQLKDAQGRRAGLDLGPSTIAAVSKSGAILSPLSADSKRMQLEIKKLQRQNPRRLRLANPANYNAHTKRRGRRTVTVYSVKKGQGHWVKSKEYLRTAALIKEKHRVMAARRKQGHDILANEILAMGTTVLTEKLSYKAWQKTFGKSVGANAPGSLINTIKRKAENADGKLIEINAWKAKLSQYDHELDSYKKKRLSERVHFVGGEIAIQRDLYSAFLALCIDEKENVVSPTTALESWSSIRHLLEAAVIRLSETASGSALPSSFGPGQLLPGSQSEPLAA